MTLNSNGSFTYDPAAGYVGSDSFSYYPKDSQTIGVTSTVTIDVREAVATPTRLSRRSFSATTLGLS